MLSSRTTHLPTPPAAAPQRARQRLAGNAALQHCSVTRPRRSALRRLAAAADATQKTTGAAGQAPQQQQTVSVANPEGGPAFPLSVQVPAGAQVYQVALKKPLGLTLTEAANSIVVDEVQPSGHAQQAGIAKGDVLLATTARAQEAGSSTPKLVLLQTRGQSFKTTAAGLRSNTCAQCAIVLVLQRPPTSS